MGPTDRFGWMGHERGHPMRYPVALSKDDNGTLLVRFPDFPEAHTFGENKDEAVAHAADALATVIDAYIKDRRDIPAPSTRKRGPVVELEPLMVAKVGLYRAMRDQKIGKAELGRRLGWHLPQVDRILNVRHTSRLDQLQQALAVLGKRVTLTVTDG